MHQIKSIEQLRVVCSQLFMRQFHRSIVFFFTRRTKQQRRSKEKTSSTLTGSTDRGEPDAFLQISSLDRNSDGFFTPSSIVYLKWAREARSIEKHGELCQRFVCVRPFSLWRLNLTGYCSRMTWRSSILEHEKRNRSAISEIDGDDSYSIVTEAISPIVPGWVGFFLSVLSWRVLGPVFEWWMACLSVCLTWPGG